MLDLINWNDEYMIGIEEFDVQHMELTLLINDLLIASQKGHPQENILKQMEMVIKYAKWHFNSEEGLMKIFQYPKLPVHKEEHQQLLIRVEEEMDWMSENILAPDKIFKFFNACFRDHITGSDVHMADFINKARERL